MPTAARGATLIILGALLAQAPLTAAAYQPRDPEPAGVAPPAEPVPSSATNCIQWSGASLRGATVWSEVAASDPD